VAQQDTQALVQQLATQLQETEEMPLRLLTLIVERCGAEFAQQVLQETIEVEAKGGLMVKKGDRRRTLGGVFFFLARNKMPVKLRNAIFGIQTEGKPKTPKAQPPKLPAFEWSERGSIIQPLLDAQGEVSTVKITLIGRPGQIEARQDLVITTMSHVVKAPALPKGVPPPPDTPTLYTIYIGSKQWRRVEEAIKAPDDALIIEGTCAFDAEIGGMAVFASNVTTKKLESAKREQQRQTPAQPAAPAVSAAPPVRAAPEPPPPSPVSSAYPNMPSDVAQKLSELHAAATLYRQKIAVLQAKPAGQQFGLEMTQKLLAKAEQEIAALEARYA
jgi:hypothetical protein